MRNIFTKKHIRINFRLSLILPIVTFLPVFFIFLYGIDSVSAMSAQKEKEGLEEALNRDIMHCYAVDGVYPPSLEFMENNYGLTYNEDKYFVDYKPVASNIYPDVTVVELYGSGR